MLDSAWARLGAATVTRTAPFRTPVVASVAEHGADARVMVLRAADRAGPSVSFYTDLRAAKVRQTAVPLAVVFYDCAAALQVRLSGSAVLAGGVASQTAWAAIPETARAVYRTVAPPGTPAASPEMAGDLAGDGLANFGVLVVTASVIEILDLDAAPHRRARFAASDGWQGSWLTP